MIRGRLESGFEFTLDDNIFDDFETVELFAKVSKNPIFVGDLAERMLGKEQKEALVEHLRDENGKVHTSAIFKALHEIENAIPAAKN